MATPIVCARCLLAWKVLPSSNKAFCYEVLKSAVFSWRIRDYQTGITRKMLLPLKVRSEMQYPLLELLSDYYTTEGNIAFGLQILPYSYLHIMKATWSLLLYLCITTFFSALPLSFKEVYQFLASCVCNQQEIMLRYWIRSPAVLHYSYPFSGIWQWKSLMSLLFALEIGRSSMCFIPAFSDMKRWQMTTKRN